MKRLASFIVLMVLAASTYAQEAPRITAITPSFGPTSGGTEVVISGTGFSDCPLPICVPTPLPTIGGIPIPVYELTATTFRFTTPPHPEGEVEVLFFSYGGRALRTTFLYTDGGESVPTLSEWALLLLAAALAAVGVMRIG